MAPPTTRTERIARRLEAERSAQGIPLHQLSTRAHIPRTTLRDQLAAVRQFKVEELFRVCEVLGFEVSDLLSEVDAQDAA